MLSAILARQRAAWTVTQDRKSTADSGFIKHR